MQSLRSGYRALVIGSSGAIGKAWVQALSDDTRCAQVLTASRSQPCPWDLTDEDSVAQLASLIDGPLHLVVDATGALTIDGGGPEKSLNALQLQALTRSFQINAAGPALLLRHLAPRLAKGERALWVKLSARVGSIEDNHKGGWYGYRAAKAALNQLLQTAAIELARSRPLAVVAAVQPGTVQSPLSRPFVGDEAMSPALAVAGLMQAVDALPATGRAAFVDYRGHPIPW